MTIAITDSTHDHYAPMLEALARNFATATESAKALFMVEPTADLWAVYMASLPPEERQSHDCRACRQFLRTLGGLATVNEHGTVSSALFGGAPAPGIYHRVFEALDAVVSGSPIKGTWHTDAPMLGTRATHDRKRDTTWQHMSVYVPPHLRSQLPTTRAAAQLEEFGMLERALGEFAPEVVQRALAVVSTGTLARSEKVAAPLTWLAGLQKQLSTCHRSDRRRNLIWRAVATAPTGFCHVRSTVAGALLEDIVWGVPMAEVQRRHAAKVDPLQYQRPSAPPRAGQVAEAERIVAELGSAGALRRRYARLEEVVARWRPQPAPEAKGVFGHLLPAAGATLPPLEVKGGVITYAKFARDVLPTATRMQVRLGRGYQHFYALVTAADASAPPIVQWDLPEARNPVTWYTNAGGTPPSAWQLEPGSWIDVTAITALPCAWGERDVGNHGQGAIFLLAGAKPRYADSLALFPEFLKSEYRAVRAVIEAYSMNGRLEGAAEASACGIALRSSSNQPQQSLEVRVTDGNGVTATYTIDRWE